MPGERFETSTEEQRHGPMTPVAIAVEAE